MGTEIGRPVFQAKDFKSELKPIWCPGCGDYRRAAGRLSRAGEHRAAAARGRVRVGHRLLEPHSRVHHRLRLQYGAWARAADRAGDQTVAPGAAGAGRRRRRRRLLDRRRSRPALHPSKPGHHLYRDGQSHLRPDERPAVADLTARAGNLIVGLRQPRGSREPASLRPGYGARFVAQGTPADMAGAGRDHRGGHPLPRVSPSSTCSHRALPTASRTRN